MASRIAALLLLAFAAQGIAATTSTFDVGINTAPLVGHAAAPFYIFFGLADGSGAGDNNNSVTVSHISLAGGAPLGAAVVSGGAGGSLAAGVTLRDSSPVSLFYQGFAPANFLVFTLTFTRVRDAGANPDRFVFAILDNQGKPIPTLAPALDPFLSAELEAAGPVLHPYASDRNRAPSAGPALDIAAPLVIQLEDLAPEALNPFLSNALGNRDRGVLFDALKSFVIAAAGVRIDPLYQGPTSLIVSIWEVTPGGGYLNLGVRGAAPLATATTPVTDIGLAFYDVPLAFAFQAGHRYLVSFNQAAPPGGWGLNTNMEFYHFGLGQAHDPPNRDNQPFTIENAVKVLGGAYGNDLSQQSLPHIRLRVLATP